MNFLSLYKRFLIYLFKRKINIDSEFLSQKNFEELFSYYGTDKASYWKDSKKGGHGYSEFYQKKLSKFKNSSINILEIGSYSGASAASFAKFFPNSKIYCLDVNISNFKYKSKQIKVIGLDVSKKNSQNKFLKLINRENNEPYFDIIIDDGSHILSDILNTFKSYFQLLKPGGYFIIEDYMHPNYFNHLKDIDHILIDKFIEFIYKKDFFTSKIFSKDEQKYLFKNIKKIENFDGNLKESKIVFIEKN